MIISYSLGEGRKEKSLKTALLLDRMEAPIISVVGAGGKTSVITRLAQEYENEGKTVIVTATTHMWQPQSGYFLRKPDMEQFAAMIKKNRPVWLGTPEPDGKMSAFPMPFLEAVRILGLPMLIEADGAAGRPLKVPDVHEPVLWGKTTVLAGVAGLDSIGREIRLVCHRPEKTALLLGKSTEDVIACEDIVTIALSSQGMKKNSDPYMRFHIVLNKADSKERIKMGEKIVRLLADRGFYRTILTANLTEAG